MMAEQVRSETLPALRISGLRKKFGQNVAVDDVDVTVNQGELYALLGPNGAGKTTTLRMATGRYRGDGLPHGIAAGAGQSPAGVPA